jgi:integrase
VRARGIVGQTILCDEKGQKLLLQRKFRSRFSKARKAAKKEIDALASEVGSEKLHELGLEWFSFQFRDLRPKAATDKERATGMAETRRFLGHTTERQTAEYVRDKIGELVNPVTASKPEWRAKVLAPKSAESSEEGNAKPLKDLEAGVGIEPAFTALQAAA